jgi:hypothetical protein
MKTVAGGLRRIKNTTPVGQALLGPAYDTFRTWTRQSIQDDGGILRSAARLIAQQKSALATAYAYRARADCALDVTCAYPGGDYFEFGSAGLCTFRNFLAAFDINSGHTDAFPDAKFWAFDIFGNPDQGSGAPTGQESYFEGWRASDDANDPTLLLSPYGKLKDRCVIVSGYFQDTLSKEFRQKLRAERRRIGFAFLDCSSSDSYALVFDFLLDVMQPAKMFIYLDEYFTDVPGLISLYDDFTAKAQERFKLRSIYMRNAGSFGALFCLMPSD